MPPDRPQVKGKGGFYHCGIMIPQYPGVPGEAGRTPQADYHGPWPAPIRATGPDRLQGACPDRAAAPEGGHA